MLYIGCHLSSSKGFAAMGRQALELGANTFQFFTRNPRGSRAKDLDPADAAALRDLLARHGFGPIVAHAPYTLNLCGAEEKNRIFARETWLGWSMCQDSITTSIPAAMWGREARPASLSLPTDSTPSCGPIRPPPFCWRPWQARAAK